MHKFIVFVQETKKPPLPGLPVQSCPLQVQAEVAGAGHAWQCHQPQECTSQNLNKFNDIQ